MEKKSKVIMMLVAVFIIILVVVISLGTPISELSEQRSLSTESSYSYNFDGEYNEDIFINCTECTSQAHYNRICFKECSDVDMIFENINYHSSDNKVDKDGSEVTIDIVLDFKNVSCECRPLVHVNEEIFAKAIREEDYTVCDEIEIEVDTFYSVGACYIILALYLEDENICENIKVEKGVASRNACYAQLANLKKDPSLCEKMQEDDLNPKSFCESSATNSSVYAYIDSPR